MTLLGPLIATMYRPSKSLKVLKGTPGTPLVDRLWNEVPGPRDPGYIYIYIDIHPIGFVPVELPHLNGAKIQII